jgi:hypothetical protein
VLILTHQVLPDFGIPYLYNMNMASKKIELIEWISKVQDKELIRKVEDLRKRAEADWWDSLTEEQKEDIEAGVADLDDGKKRNVKQVLAKYRKK